MTMNLATSNMLALDLGDQKTGVAFIEKESWLVVPLADIPGIVLKKAAKKAIAELVFQRNIEIVVLGIPYDQHGKEGAQAKKVAAFARSLQPAIPAVKIEFVDERFTSFQADQEMRKMALAAKHRKKNIHAASAMLILESYLATH